MNTSSAVSIYSAVVATYAATISTLAIIWQVISWKKSGPIVRIESRWVEGTDRKAGDFEVVHISVYNVGREPIQIDQVGLTARDRGIWHPFEAETPITLDGSHGLQAKEDVCDINPDDEGVYIQRKDGSSVPFEFTKKNSLPYVETTGEILTGKWGKRR